MLLYRKSENARDRLCLMFTEAKPPVLGVGGEKQVDKMGMMLQQQIDDVMPRPLQDEMRRSSVDKGSAMLLEQEMKKRSSRNYISP